MLRLTLRSSKDGRFLARIVDRGGFPFVLDFGDKRIIEDVAQRLLHGFTMWRFGRLITAPPNDPEMLNLLADFYSGEGLLVFLEEPTWSLRQGLVAPEALAAGAEIGAAAADLPEQDEQTEMAGDALPERDDETEIARIDVHDLALFYDQSEPTGADAITERDAFRFPGLDDDDDDLDHAEELPR